MKKYGFTLVELVMVIVIIGMLAAIVLPNFGAQREHASIAMTKANLDALRKAVALYYIHVGDYTDLNVSSPPLRPLFDGSGAANGRIFMPEVPFETISTPSKTDIVLNPPTGSGGWVWDSTSHEVKVNLIGVDINGQDYSDY